MLSWPKGSPGKDVGDRVGTEPGSKLLANAEPVVAMSDKLYVHRINTFGEDVMPSETESDDGPKDGEGKDAVG